MKSIKAFIGILIFGSLLISCSEEEQRYQDDLQGKVKKEILYIAPKVPGRILEIRVKEGEVIQQGDTLAVLDIPEVEAKYQQAQGALMAAQNQYEMARHGATIHEREQVEAMFQAATEQFGLAQKTYQRLNQMYQDSLISSQKYDEILTKYMSAKAQLEAAKAKRNDVEGGLRSEKIEMARGDMIRAEGALKETEAALKEKYLVAPSQMQVETIALQPGELALPGYNIFVGYLPGSAFFRFTIGESEVMNYKIGQTFKVKQAFDQDKLYQAKLVSIKHLNAYADQTSPFPEYELGESVYELKLLPTDPTSRQELIANIKVLMEE
ncbi:MAG: HlyD family secretion protein [Candidatus Cyclobacteriaceae bacterium M3_2C_046]